MNNEKRIQPRKLFIDSNTIEQPRIFGLNSIFKGLGKKATLKKFDKNKTHQEIWTELASNTKQENFRVESFQGKDYTMIVNGLELCIQTDMALLWSLFSLNENEGTILLQDLCNIMKKKNNRCSRTNKSIIEGLYRLSNNTFNVATNNWSGTFQLLEIERAGYSISYKFNERLIDFMNSGECLKRFEIDKLVSLKRAASKAIYTYIESIAFNKSNNSFEFLKQDIIKLCGLESRRKDKAVVAIKEALLEMRDNNLIESFSIVAQKIKIIRTNKKAIVDDVVVDMKKVEQESREEQDKYDLMGRF